MSVKGLEPLTNGLKGRCSPIELHARSGVHSIMPLWMRQSHCLSDLPSQAEGAFAKHPHRQSHNLNWQPFQSCRIHRLTASSDGWKACMASSSASGSG